MPKKQCRYNNKHKFDTDEALLSHEKYCPDKSKRTDLKECPFSNKHIVLTKQYEKHIKKSKTFDFYNEWQHIKPLAYEIHQNQRN